MKKHTACETAFTLFADADAALSRARDALAGMGFEVKPGPVPASLRARRPSFRAAPAAGVAVNTRNASADQTTLSVRAWGVEPRAACERLAQALGVRPAGSDGVDAPGPEDLRGAHGYSLADVPARARRQLFGGAIGQLVYSASIGLVVAILVILLF